MAQSHIRDISLIPIKDSVQSPKARAIPMPLKSLLQVSTKLSYIQFSPSGLLEDCFPASPQSSRTQARFRQWTSSESLFLTKAWKRTCEGSMPSPLPFVQQQSHKIKVARATRLPHGGLLPRRVPRTCTRLWERNEFLLYHAEEIWLFATCSYTRT